MVANKEIENQVEEVIEQLRPYFFMHGGNINFVKYEDGKVYVSLHGACSGCPSSSYTLKLMVEESLKKEVPQVEEVIEVE